MTEPEFICKLQEFIYKKYKTNVEAAKKWVVSPQFVSKVVTGKSRPTQDMIDDMGFTKSERLVVDYTKVKK
jgi:hypothetical protein